MKKRIARKILKCKDRLRYTPRQIRKAEQKLSKPGSTSSEKGAGKESRQSQET